MAHLDISPAELDVGEAVIDGIRYIRVYARDPETGDSTALIFNEHAFAQVVPQLNALVTR